MYNPVQAERHPRKFFYARIEESQPKGKTGGKKPPTFLLLSIDTHFCKERKISMHINNCLLETNKHFEMKN